MTTIHTPYGVAPAESPEPPNAQAQLRALCGDIALIEAEQARLAADSAHQGVEIAIALADLGTLRRSVAELRRELCALRRRVAYRRRGAPR
jgi:plasmid stabilization system protein ParE